MEINKVKLFLVDDDALFLKSLEIDFLATKKFDVETFPSGEMCIENLIKKPDIIVLDYHLDGINVGAINGIETLDIINIDHGNIPVIILSSQDKIEVAVNCMHHKASDYVVKSETSFFRLTKIIDAILLKKKLEMELRWYMDRM